MRKYILKNGTPVATPDMDEWGRWFQESKDERIVKQEQIGPAFVSTVFLGLDHRFGKGPPILWETMVFGGVWDQACERCAGTQEQAEAMHERMVKQVKEEKPEVDT